ncbi:hypothetical protein HYX14_03250 [Candidatus Woesearchaeota archaeon]|nr:hypothetical protein [Candidatus Woesearchaeota archaeon]
MEKAIKKAVKAGYGLGLLTLEQARRVAGRIKSELNLDDAASKKLAKELVHSSRKASMEVLHVVSRNFEKAISKSGVAKPSTIRKVKRKAKKVWRRG